MSIAGLNSRWAALALSAIIVTAPNGWAAQPAWQKKLRKELPLLGHRNWIVVADAAYPWQTAPGIETISTEADQLEVLGTVFGCLDKAKHVKPTVFTDAELLQVPEQDAPGVTAYRNDLKKLLVGRQTQSLAHEQIIARLDEAGKTFHILLLKTKLTIPYTSVFLRLDCGYWNDAAEKKLREKLKNAREP